jgi:hypothetical protein
MGQVTPNISIYIPAAGETNYDASFAAGMINIDQHDHSGPPTKGVPIATSGIADFSITYNKLNANVVTAGGGLAVSGVTPNSLQVAGILTSLFNIPAGGILVATSTTTAINRRIVGTAGRIVVTNDDGIAGNPTINIDPTFLPAAPNIIVQKFTTGVSTYTPSANMTNCQVEIVAAGGNGGSSGSSGTGGGAGGYSRKVFTASAIGASQTVTLAASGTPSTFGALLTCNSGSNGSTAVAQGGAGGTATGGDLNVTGGDGNTAGATVGGTGGASYFGGGGSGGSSVSAGSNGNAYGSGGGGGGGGNAGGNGAAAYCIITEYIN